MGAEKPILMPHQMLDTFVQIGQANGNAEIEWTPFANLLRTAVEAVVASPSIALVSLCRAASSRRHGMILRAWHDDLLYGCFTVANWFIVLRSSFALVEVGSGQLGRGCTSRISPSFMLGLWPK
jgi:hypothetical protein